jgi:hypothetical protein
VDPKLFIPDPDLVPTSEKFRIRIVEIREFTASPVFLKINYSVVSFLKKKIVKFSL